MSFSSLGHTELMKQWGDMTDPKTKNEELEDLPHEDHDIED